MSLITRPGTVEDAEGLAPRLRPDDVREIELISQRTPAEVLPVSVSVSSECYTFRSSPNGDPFAIFGVTADPCNQGVGIVWFLGTPEVSSHKLAILRESLVWLKYWGEKYAALHNVVYSANELHVRWLIGLGFTMEPLEIRGHQCFHAVLHSERSQSACV